MRDLGVTIVSPYAGKHALAECDLGVTGADAGFPETGTLLLRSTPERPRMVSLVPRIHLALITPAILLPDLSQGFAQVKGEGYWVFVTGPEPDRGHRARGNDRGTRPEGPVRVGRCTSLSLCGRAS